MKNDEIIKELDELVEQELQRQKEIQMQVLEIEDQMQRSISYAAGLLKARNLVAGLENADTGLEPLIQDILSEKPGKGTTSRSLREMIILSEKPGKGTTSRSLREMIIERLGKEGEVAPSVATRAVTRALRKLMKDGVVQSASVKGESNRVYGIPKKGKKKPKKKHNRQRISSEKLRREIRGIIFSQPLGTTVTVDGVLVSLTLMSKDELIKRVGGPDVPSKGTVTRELRNLAREDSTISRRILPEHGNVYGYYVATDKEVKERSSSTSKAIPLPSPESMETQPLPPRPSEVSGSRTEEGS